MGLCAGIGGLELGLASVISGYRTVAFVEGEAYAAACLVARMEQGRLDSAPIWSDLRTFDGQPWRGAVDIVTAGYPCQPFSVAGNRKGADDPRHLWPHVARVIRECEPAFAFLENVPGHVSLGLESVATDLRAMGYSVQAGIFSAAQCGAPHLRKRLFILAANARGVELWQQSRRRRGPVGQGAALAGIYGASGVDSNAYGQGQLQSQGIVTGERRWAGDVGRKDMWPWLVESPICSVDDGISNRLDRLRALGNAVVPQVAALAFHALGGGQ